MNINNEIKGYLLKDLGKKWFSFSKMEAKAMEMITNLNNEVKC